MFSRLRRNRLTRRNRVDVGDKQSSSPQGVNVDMVFKPQTEVHETPATTVSTPTEAPKEKTKKVPWWLRWFRRKKTHVKEDVPEETNLPSSVTGVDTVEDTEGGETVPQEASSTPVDTIQDSEGGEDGLEEASFTPDAQVSASPKKKKPRWRLRFFLGGKKQNSVHTCKESQVIRDQITTDASRPRQPIPAGHGGCPQAQCDNIGQGFTCTRTKALSSEELAHLGFPNLAQTCYMNSFLQSLLSLSPFIQEVYNQQEVWSSYPGSQLTREFVEVEASRASTKTIEKALVAFKRAVADHNMEFEDDGQKDAVEFLSCVLDIMMSQSDILSTAALSMGIKYTCPVRAHIFFQMLSTRTCKGCGMQSTRTEDYLNLSLDVVHGGSVNDCLQEYLGESQVEFSCDCNSFESSQQLSFSTLPNVLILQLKRFRFTPSFNLEKVVSPVILSRELIVNAESSPAKQTRYSLVSIISHLGDTAHSGHYICDAAQRDRKQGEMTERWLAYNDNDVKETTATSACHQRSMTAYLLMYEKRG